MKELKSRALWTLIPLSCAMAASVLLVGCSGKSNVPEPEVTVKDIPPWYQSPPSDPEYLYGMGTGESQEMQMAVDKAEQNARVQLTRNAEAKVSALFKQFSEESGVGEAAEYIAMATNVSKTVASGTIGSTRIEDQKIVPEGGRYRAYVLVEMPVGAVAARLQSQIQADQRVHTRFRASQGYKDLVEDAEAFEKFKKEEAGNAGLVGQ